MYSNKIGSSSFVDVIIELLGKKLRDGSLAPQIHVHAVDTALKLSKQLTNIYGGSRCGHQQALAVVIRLAHRRLSL